MNILYCAQLLMLVSDTTKWTECVLGNQLEGQSCVCRLDYLKLSKCFATSVCQVIIRYVLKNCTYLPKLRAYCCKALYRKKILA